MEDKSNCLFSLLNGFCTCDNSNLYKFGLINGEYFSTKYINTVCDPCYDSTFKLIFGNNPKRLANFLNSIYFLDNKFQIKELIILQDEFTVIGKLFNHYTLRSDFICKCKLLNMKDEILVDIKMQIGRKKDLDLKSINYGIRMKGYYSNEKNTNSLVLGIIADKNIKDINSSQIKLVKEEKYTNNKIELKSLKIININLSNEINRLVEVKDAKEFCNDRNEWIKFIGLRFWWNKFEENRYILPLTVQEIKLNHNNHINECVFELSHFDNFQLNMIYEIENHDKIVYKEGEKKGEIKLRFKAYKLGK